MFYVSYQIGDCNIRLHPNENMNVVWHSVDTDKFLPFVLNYSRDVFVKLVFVVIVY